jgi:HprK-related kinase B
MAGSSGMGKSTLALQVLARGADYVSNDRLMVKRQGDRVTMVGVPKLPRVNPGTILNNPALRGLMSDAARKAAESLPRQKLWELEDKYDVFIDRFFGPGRFKLEARMSGLVLLNWQPTEAPLRIRRIDLRHEPQLLDAFMKPTGVFYDPEEDYESPSLPQSQYIETLDPCDVFELSGGASFDAAAAACDSYLRTGEM